MSLGLHFMNLPFRRIFCNSLYTSAVRRGTDAREKRLGHIKKNDQVEGEKESGRVASKSSFELVDENLMSRLFNGVKFEDIPKLYIKCTRNNTKISLIGDDGLRVLKTAGTEGFKNCRKGTTVAAQAVANKILTIAKEKEVDQVRLIFNGLGPGRNASYKVFELSDLKVVSLSDRTEAIEPWILRPRKAKRI